MEKYHFFWGGIYSNWYKSPFKIDIAGVNIEFNCVEQYMMYSKAILFKDFEIAAEIMNCSNPRDQKALGKEVRNFDIKVWEEKRIYIVSKGIYAKFLQNEDLQKQLMQEDCKEFVEASPYDRIWGIGYSEKDALENIPYWGENLLGKIITDLRDSIVRIEQGIIS